MKKYVRDFIRRGLTVCAFGPLVLAIVYGILRRSGVIEFLTVRQVCTGIFSLTALAFVAGGMNTVYQLERLPLMAAILIHGSVLYLGYLATYLFNDWMEWGGVSILVFTGIFVAGYLVIWLVIYSIVKEKTQRINRLLQEKQKNENG